MYNKHPFFLDKHLLGSHHSNCCCRIFFHDEKVHELETWSRSHFQGFYELTVFNEKNILITIDYFVFKHLVYVIYDSSPYTLYDFYTQRFGFLWFRAQLHVFNQHIPFKLSWAFVCRHLVDVSYISCCSVVDVVVSASH